MVTWGIRGVLGLSLIVLAVLALSGAARTPAPEPTSAPSVLSAPAVGVQPTSVGFQPASAVPPTPTVEPFVQRVISRVARETQAPYPTATPLPNGLVGVSAVDFGYMPSVIRIHVGQTVRWRNDGSEKHDITGDDWHSGAMEPTIEFRETFGSTGRFNYRCSIHPDMTGVVIVDP